MAAAAAKAASTAIDEDHAFIRIGVRKEAMAATPIRKIAQDRRLATKRSGSSENVRIGRTRLQTMAKAATSRAGIKLQAIVEPAT